VHDIIGFAIGLAISIAAGIWLGQSLRL